MKPLNTAILIAFASLLSLSNCNRDRCGPSETTIEPLRPSTLSKIPYSGYDTLRFLNQHKDTCIVRGLGKETYYTPEYQPNGEPICPRNILQREGYRIQFTPLKGDLNFTINLIDNGKMQIEVKQYTSLFSIAPTRIGTGLDPYFPELYIDTMTLNDKLYTNIDRAYALYKSRPFELDTTNIYNLYLNKQYGLLKISDAKNNEEYSILSYP